MARLLIVDDDVRLVALMRFVLEHAGHAVEHAEHGLAALERLGVEPPDADKPLPDLLLLDAMMPVMDGYTTAVALKEAEKTARLPILVLTSKTDLRALFESLPSVKGFFPKPFDPASLRAAVAGALNAALVLLALLLPAGARAFSCPEPARFTLRSGITHEAYSFAGPGNGGAVVLRDRAFRGWDAHVGAGYQHRFRLDDAEVWAGAVRKIPGTRAYAGGSVGGATRHVLLPALRAALEGGAGLGSGFSADARTEWRRYDNAHTLVFSPGLTWEGSGLELSAGYAVSSAWYSSRASSGALSSWRVRAAWARWCRLKPWVGWARSREPFEVGSGRGVSNFAADHWSAGAEWRVSGGWAVDASFRRELRDGSAGRISHLGAGLSYSWGPL